MFSLSVRSMNAVWFISASVTSIPSLAFSFLLFSQMKAKRRKTKTKTSRQLHTRSEPMPSLYEGA